jgi:hypothetical protein
MRLSVLAILVLAAACTDSAAGGGSGSDGDSGGDSAVDSPTPDTGQDMGVDVEPDAVEPDAEDPCDGREELCDGLDNDCDGEVDEGASTGLVCLTQGVCEGTQSTCRDGEALCEYPDSHRIPDLVCDGIDNNCDGIPDNGTECGGRCCEGDETCHARACITPRGTCLSDDDCEGDTYCDEGECIPYGARPRGESNPDCRRLIIAGVFQPTVQCEWTGPPPGDPFPDHIQVLGAPVVVDFGFNPNAKRARPSIVFNSYDGLDGDSGVFTELDGVLRVIDGATCQTQYTWGPLTNGCNTPALGDLDGDGRPEIVIHMNDQSVRALTYDPDADEFIELWRGHVDGVAYIPPGSRAGWGAPSLVDLDDDGLPEVLSGGLVYGPDGTLISDAYPFHYLFGNSNVGYPVAADLDMDGKVELAAGDAVLEWDSEAESWRPDYPGTARGFTAVADFGTFGDDPEEDDRATLDGIAEVVSVSGVARIDSLAGRTVFGPAPLPGSTGGGPPTVGDFDGDGRAEFSAAGSDSITVFDPDCTGDPDPEYCPTLRTDGILWTQPSQDHSSSVTGMSLFDFDGDGSVEVVYADEVFVRVYNGQNGTVLFSHWHSSCTWNENPIVADVDGDFAAELVVPSNESCDRAPETLGGLDYETSPANLPMDPLFAGLRCAAASDCPGGDCGEGLCRCTNDDHCGGGGFVCAPPPRGTPGTGNTCRAHWIGSVNGIRVYGDILDRWVGSRTIWNQHAYAITNVNDDGSIPRTSERLANWTVEGLNSFRQNIQGDLRPEFAPDLTTRPGIGAECVNGQLALTAHICNRGANPVAAGVLIGVFRGGPGGDLVCGTTVDEDLSAGECAEVECDVAGLPEAQELTWVADFDQSRTECHEGNNLGTITVPPCPAR